MLASSPIPPATLTPRLKFKMPPTEFPKYPTLPSLRLANAKDIDRMAGLSVLGFKDSEILRYERPHFKEYPQDALTSFANIYRSQLSDPLAITIVSEDWRVPDELSDFPQRTDPPAAERVVVGVASWNLPKGSRRAGQFVVPDVGHLEPSPDRDLCQHRLNLFTRITEVEEKKYLEGSMTCNKLVVHPSYGGKGHATFMLQWGLRLCEADSVNQGVIPSHIGEPLYVSLGYKVIGEIKIPDDGDVEGFTQRVALYSVQ
ncbi:unnamed protein product [Periconia digitata]|uniref:N-acetyltransferase domain-containing protein n=1 Tax=Periconia digitata TaxID=1303443 RepID=A0A9W4UI00_9PLEO|nr:unnamed protein product [Periconia digitata]